MWEPHAQGVSRSVLKSGDVLRGVNPAAAAGLCPSVVGSEQPRRHEARPEFPEHDMAMQRRRLVQRLGETGVGARIDESELALQAPRRAWVCMTRMMVTAR